MNDLVRPASYYTGGIAANAPLGVLATVPNPPPDIARLPAGTTLRGVVIGSDGKGHTLIKTDQGVLAVATKLVLAKDSEVVLQIRSSGVQLHVMVMQARGQAIAPAPQGDGRPAGPGLAPGGGLPQVPPPSSGALANPRTATTGLSAPGGGQTDLLNLGQIVRAVVQGPANPGPATGLAGQPAVAGPVGAAAEIAAGRVAGVVAGGPLPAGLTALAPGTVLALQIRAVSPPGLPQGQGPGQLPGAAATAGPTTPSGPLGASYSATGATVNPGASAVSAQPGTPLSGPQGAIAAAAQGSTGKAQAPAQQPAALGPGPAALQARALGLGAGPGGGASGSPLVFSAQVTSITHAGHPVLGTPLGILTLEVEARIPIGSRLALELAPSGLPRGAEAAARFGTAGALGHAWPALEEALVVLSEPATGSPGVPQGVPQPGPRLTSGLLFFMAALSGGDLGRWLGAEALQTLRGTGRESLVGRLSRDLAQMGRMAEGTTGTTGDWRVLPIPLWDGDHVRQLRLFLRQQDERKDGKQKERSNNRTRFVLELEMSRMGEMQLDGLVRDKRFDLVMRTRAALPVAMQRDIQKIFEDASQAAGYSGQLGFQASADWHYLPYAQDAASGPPPGLIV